MLLNFGGIFFLSPQFVHADTCKKDSECKVGVCIGGNCALFKPEISIPGLDYKSLQPDYSTKPIAEYINAIYKYLVGIVGIVSAVVLMIGGVIWIMAGGSSEKVGEAKNWIGASLFGLLIAMLAYSILNTINPALVNFKVTKIQNVEALGCCELTNGGCLPSTNASDCPKSKGRFVAGGPFSCNGGKCIQDTGGCCRWKESGSLNYTGGCSSVNSSADCHGDYSMNKKCNAVKDCSQYGSKCDGTNDGISCDPGYVCWGGDCTICFKQGDITNTTLPCNTSPTESLKRPCCEDNICEQRGNDWVKHCYKK